VQVLLTGFDRFGPHPLNPSELVVRALAGAPGLIAEVLPTQYEPAGARIAALIERWRRDEPIERLAMAPRPLRHCSKARLATDRQLNWRWPAARVERWVRALAALAPAWWVDMHGRRTEVMQARTLSGVPASSCGTVLHREGRWIEIACEDGAIALRCRHAFRAAAGDRLPLVTHAPNGAA